MCVHSLYQQRVDFPPPLGGGDACHGLRRVSMDHLIALSRQLTTCEVIEILDAGEYGWLSILCPPYLIGKIHV